MISALDAIHSIENVPFAGIMHKSDPRPVLFDLLVPDIDLVIWKMRPCAYEPAAMEICEAALQALDLIVESEDSTPGAAICELDGYSLFAFRTAHREMMLAAMEIKDVVPW